MDQRLYLTLEWVEHHTPGTIIYDTLNPASVREWVDALIDGGFVAKVGEGLNTRIAVTPSGGVAMATRAMDANVPGSVAVAVALLVRHCGMDEVEARRVIFLRYEHAGTVTS